MASSQLTEHECASERAAMVRRVMELISRTEAETDVGGLDPPLRAALEAVPRHRFVPERITDLAYDDAALSIGFGQTISQPFIVALMTQLARVGPSSKVLEIGTGSGYQAAILAELASAVYSVELVPELAFSASATLADLGYTNVEVRQGDGFEGWAEHAPFDAILVAAVGPEPPPRLVDQLAPGGRMILPLGEAVGSQWLSVLERSAAGAVSISARLPVGFVPLIHEDSSRQS